jgi:hypothetical protein
MIMPFSAETKEAALVKSRRYCCVCHEFAGRSVNVHHIIQEADGGPNKLDNAIVLCLRCHAEAGHYNLHHPLGTKYSPSELRRHRDEWWKYCESYSRELRPDDIKHLPSSAPKGQDLAIIEKEIGTLWSNWLNMPEESEIIRFEGKLIGQAKTEDMNGPTWYELYQLQNGRYVVYSIHNHRADWCTANLTGVNAWGEFDPPLTLSEVQDGFPVLAKAAGLVRIRQFKP